MMSLLFFNTNLLFQFLKHLRKYDISLSRIPAFEKSLSHVLRNIKIGRRYVVKECFYKYSFNISFIGNLCQR